MYVFLRKNKKSRAVHEEEDLQTPLDVLYQSQARLIKEPVTTTSHDNEVSVSAYSFLTYFPGWMTDFDKDVSNEPGTEQSLLGLGTDLADMLCHRFPGCIFSVGITLCKRASEAPENQMQGAGEKLRPRLQ